MSPLNAITKRGGPFFDSLTDIGFEVLRLQNGSTETIAFRKPWTFVYGPVPDTDITEWIAEATKAIPWSSVILDVCFPVMQPELIGGDPESVQRVLDHRDVILENIKAACAVTTPHKDWAAALAEVNPRTWWVPDILFDPNTDIPEGDLDNATIDELEERAETLTTFGIRFSEMLQATYTVCSAKDAPCEESGTS